jgi:hypothetical protein
VLKELFFMLVLVVEEEKRAERTSSNVISKIDPRFQLLPDFLRRKILRGREKARSEGQDWRSKQEFLVIVLL